MRNKPVNFFTWYGGKGKLAGKIARYIPQGGMPYVEPFCGGAAVYFALNPVPPIVVLNDINRWINNFFRVMRDEVLSEKLIYMLEWTQHSRADWERAREIYRSGGEGHSEIERAWAFFVLACQSVSAALNAGWSYSKSYSRRGMSQSTSTWVSRIESLGYLRERLMRAQIDCIDGIECIAKYDSPSAVFYVDPPYVLSTRVEKDVYPDEVDDKYHYRLVDQLLKCQGAVVLSGYDNEIYQPLVDNGWDVIRFVTKTCARVAKSGEKRGEREEVLWINKQAQMLLYTSGGLYGQNHQEAK
jgi:DNA adenine methylase